VFLKSVCRHVANDTKYVICDRNVCTTSWSLLGTEWKSATNVRSLFWGSLGFPWTEFFISYYDYGIAPAVWCRSVEVSSQGRWASAGVVQSTSTSRERTKCDFGLADQRGKCYFFREERIKCYFGCRNRRGKPQLILHVGGDIQGGKICYSCYGFGVNVVWTYRTPVTRLLNWDRCARETKEAGWNRYRWRSLILSWCGKPYDVK